MKKPDRKAAIETRRGLNRFLSKHRRAARRGSYKGQDFLPRDITIDHLVSKYEKLAGTDYRRISPPVIKNAVTLVVPGVFSLTRAANQSFCFISDLIRALHEVRAPLLIIDYANCIEVDLDASVCMDAILRLFIKRHLLLRHHYKERAAACAIRAVNLRNRAVRRFFWTTGAGQSIHERNLTFTGILRLPLQTGKQDPSRLGRNEKTITDLFEHLEKCLARFGKQLTSKDAERFGDIIGEVLDNAEQHSSLPFNYAIAHFEEHLPPPVDPDETAENTLPKGEHYGRFQIVIFNFGQTIYERLNDPVACKTRDRILPQMRSLSEHYNRKGWFGLKEKPFAEETLYTLFSLQDGVSSLRPDRGRGTVRFITDFLALRSKSENKKSLLTLMSGNTRIHLDGSYGIIEAKNSLGETQRRITFNESGSLLDKPDSRVVTFVPHYLPGTLLYADIYLTDEHLQPA